MRGSVRGINIGEIRSSAQLTATLVNEAPRKSSMHVEARLSALAHFARARGGVERCGESGPSIGPRPPPISF